MLRSILSVVTGVVVWGLLWVGANAGLAGAMPSSFDEAGVSTVPLVLTLFIAISAALSVLAGWLCAAIAPAAAMKHVTVLAVIQLAIGIMVQVGVWSLMPVWYHVIFLALVVPMHVVGGRLKVGSDAGASPVIG